MPLCAATPVIQIEKAGRCWRGPLLARTVAGERACNRVVRSANAAVLLIAMLCARVWGQQGNVAGVVVDAVTHQPLAGVHIKSRLFRGDVRVSKDLKLATPPEP